MQVRRRGERVVENKMEIPQAIMKANKQTLNEPIAHTQKQKGLKTL